MKERTVVLTFEIETDRRLDELQASQVIVPIRDPYSGSGWDSRRNCIIRPVNKPRVEVIQTAKAKGKRR